jgi:uncharacterized membrane protein
MLFFAVKYLNLIGAAVLLGTGAGIAFFQLMAHRTGDAATIAGVAHIVVIADFLFTASAVVLQPITASYSSCSTAIRSARVGSFCRSRFTL